jgi:hypothetical protein
VIAGSAAFGAATGATGVELGVWEAGCVTPPAPFSA